MTHPVVFVDYSDALAYSRWCGKRLPTQEEWEKAARGDKGYSYPWGNAPTVSKCNARESEIGESTEVTRFRSGVSPYGIYDMAGNVWEWCDSSIEDGRKILKAGSFHTPFEHAMPCQVNDAFEHMMDDDTGFRCALDIHLMEDIMK